MRSSKRILRLSDLAARIGDSGRQQLVHCRVSVFSGLRCVAEQRLVGSAMMAPLRRTDLAPASGSVPSMQS